MNTASASRGVSGYSPNRAPGRNGVSLRWIQPLLWGVLLFAGACRNPLYVDIQETVAQVVQPPAARAVFPADEADDVPVNTQIISVTFDKAISASSVTASSFYVVPLTGSGTPGTAMGGSRSVQNETITFTPAQALAFDTTYRVVVTTDVRDVDGNRIPEALTWHFRTGLSPDTVPPTNPSIIINGGAPWTSSRKVSLDLSATDDRGVAQMNISATSSFAEGNWVTYETRREEWSLDEVEGLHTLSVRFRDGAGNLSAIAGAQIRLDMTPPLVTQFLLNEGRNATREPVVPIEVIAADPEGGSGIESYRMRSGVLTGASATLDELGVAWLDWEPLDDGQAVIEEQSIDPAESYPDAPVLELGQTVTFEVQVRDVAGNVAVLAETDEPGRRTIRWDRSPPGIAEVRPADGATNVVVNAGIIQITFDEEMDRETFDSGSFTVRRVGSADPIAGSIGFAEGGAAITLTEITLEQNADYVARVVGTVTDVAGNPLGHDYSWFFSTADAIDDTPPTGSLSLTTGLRATDTQEIALVVDATDDWNTVRAIKVWGDNDGSLPAFEETASWQLLPVPLEGHTIDWVLPPGDGRKYVYYKFQDSALNENPVAYRLSVSLDTVPPTIFSVSLDGGNEFTNDPGLTVSVEVDAADETSGISEMRLSNDGVFDDTHPETGAERWRPWSPIVSGWVLSEGDGPKTVSVQVRDGVNLESPVVTDTITLDLTPPVVAFTAADVLNVHAAAVQGGTITDENGIASYAWSRQSGPGTVTFSDPSVAQPIVWADADGEYVLRVDVVDRAGNPAFGTVGFIRDTVPPSSAPVVTVDEYNTTGQPTFTWSPVDDADYYRVSFAQSLDWTDPADYEQTNQTAFTPTLPLAEGAHTLLVTAWDIAGNSSPEPTGSATVFVDTIAPFITNEGQYFLTNVPLRIRYDGTEGSDGSIIEVGSGLLSLLWAQIDGPADGALEFDDPSSATPLVTALGAGSNGVYELQLTATDVAGNERRAAFAFEWDTTPPEPPQVSGPVTTPNPRPTWSWTTGGGGGAEVFRYRLDDGQWSEETAALSFRPDDPLADGEQMHFEVQERDEAGNWSGSGSALTLIDYSSLVPPQVLGTALTNVSSLAWQWSSGIGEDPGVAEYEYRVREPGGAWSAWSPRSTLETASSTATVDGIYTIQVREYLPGGDLVSGDEADWGSSATTYDTTPPDPPALTAPSPTNSGTPTWQWTAGGGDGVGRYRIALNGSLVADDVAVTSFTPSSPLAEGSHTLNVRERDLAGNWSLPGIRAVTVDLTPPVVGSFAVTDPTALNPGWARSTTVNLSISGSGSPHEMRFQNHGLSWGVWMPYASTVTGWQLPTGDGWKHVSVQLRDEAGNTSTVGSASIQLDITAPQITSFTINGGATSTTSTYVTLNSVVTGATEMAVVNGSATPTSWVPYASSRAWYLTNGVGAKQVRVQYRDAAGNQTGIVPARIHHGAPTSITATKGATSNGSITVRWTSYGAEVGTTSYRVYTSASPTGHKQLVPKGFIYDGTSATGTLPPGTLYYFHVRAVNNVLGESDLYSPYAIGFSSDITVIHNANNSTDTALANAIRSTLTTNWPSVYSTSISGTMPQWTVTLVPESEISNSWVDPAVDDALIIYGDPLIVTHGTTFFNAPNRVRNVIDRSASAGNGRAGIVAMGLGGGRMLDTATSNWTTWGYGDQVPSDIRYGRTAGFTSETVRVFTWTTGNSVWHSPLESTSLGSPPAHESRTQITYSTTSSYGGGYLSPRYSIYRGDRSNPPGGFLYGRDDDSNLYFPVARQGRFLFYGFTTMVSRPFTGSVYYVNLISRMSWY